jgi:outer membrane protein OmpA-like peptidoglycan-associated protein
MRTVKPIPRRRAGILNDEPLVDGIPTGRLGNRSFPTASLARQAAIEEVNRLNQVVYPGHSVARSDAHQPGELPHYHVIDPQGNQISGHFFYGKKPYRVEPNPGSNLRKSIAAAKADLNPQQLSAWQEERQSLQKKLESGQANRQEKGRFNWLNQKLRTIHQQTLRDAKQLGAEIHASRQSKQKAQQEQEEELSKQGSWLFETPFKSVVSTQNTDASCAGSKTEIITNWGRYGSKVSPGQQLVIDKLADLIVSSFAQSICPPFRQVEIVGHADKDWQGAKKETSVSFERAMAVQQSLAATVRRLWLERKMGAPPKGGVAWATRGQGAKNMIAPPYSVANRRVVVTLLRSGSPVPIPQNDTLEKRIERLIKLLETRRVIPDSTGTRTSRAKCLLPKLLNSAVIDIFVDGGVSNQTINGMTPKFHECLIPGRNVGWLGNYDGTKRPMPNSEFFKFLSTLRPILKGGGFAPTQSDDDVLRILGQVILRIDEGITMVDAYITKNSMMSAPFIESYSGDVARKKLQQLYRNNLNDPNNIYSCYR